MGCLPELNADGNKSMAVIYLNRALFIGVFRDKYLAEDCHFLDFIDVFQAFYVNKYANYHINEFI